MSPALNTLPPATKAEIIRRILAMKHPKLEKAPLAAHFQLTLTELDALLNHHGYPDRDVMARHVRELQAQADAPEPSHNAPDTTELAEEGAVDPRPPVPGFEVFDRNTPQRTSNTATTAPEVTAADDEDPIGKLTRVKLTRLLADPRNLRDGLPDIEDLAQTIKEAGLIHPILVRTEGPNLIVVDGHRRLAALRLLRHDVAEVIIKPSMRTAQVLAAMLITSGQRADLDPIEEARGLMRLKVERGNCSDAEVASVVGRNQAFVSARLALLNLTPEQQEEVRAGNMKLVEATHTGRMNAGQVRKTGQDKNWHFGPQHSLGNRVKGRCIQMGHSRGRTVGGMGCGACWEYVIRTDERVALVQNSMRTGTCDTCGGLTTSDAERAEHAEHQDNV